ncbi:MAG: hypothetical protein ACW99U_06175 [Candidatus Thorarchaeota archaeon]
MKKLLVTLTPSESKRLIAKGLLATTEIQEALKEGYVCITMGTTSSYLAEELLGEYDKSRHVAGVVIPRGVWVTDGSKRYTDAIFHNGKYLEKTKIVDVLSKLGPGDIIIKSANAIDINYIPIVLLASVTGGTVGSFLGSAAARNITVVTPVGLEKCIHSSYEDFVGQFGLGNWDYTIGVPVGAIAMPEAIVFTEVEALEALFGIIAVPIAAGGVNGAEGAVTLFLEGAEEDIQEAFALFKEIKGEPPFPKIEHIKD